MLGVGEWSRGGGVVHYEVHAKGHTRFGAHTGITRGTVSCGKVHIVLRTQPDVT